MESNSSLFLINAISMMTVLLVLTFTVAIVAISRRIKRELAIRKALNAIKKIREYRNRTCYMSQSYGK